MVMVMSPEGFRLIRALLIDHRVELLRRSALMSGLGEEALRSVAHHLHGEKFTRGTVICSGDGELVESGNGVERLIDSNGEVVAGGGAGLEELQRVDDAKAQARSRSTGGGFHDDGGGGGGGGGGAGVHPPPFPGGGGGDGGAGSNAHAKKEAAKQKHAAHHAAAAVVAELTSAEAQKMLYFVKSGMALHPVSAPPGVCRPSCDWSREWFTES